MRYRETLVSMADLEAIDRYFYPEVKSLSELKSIVDEAYNVMLSMQSMDMFPEHRGKYIENKNTLYKIKAQIAKSIRQEKWEKFWKKFKVFFPLVCLIVMIIGIILSNNGIDWGDWLGWGGGIGLVISSYFIKSN